jgi:choline dehydrogenase-like flavoprotein
MSALDRATVCTAEDILDSEFRRLDIGRLDERPADEATAWPSSLVGGWHQLGTTRMHRDPKHGVVDANGRMHNMSNLFVAGGSVFPTCGTATPTLTIVALALRLGEHLRSTDFPGRRPSGPII